MVLGLQPLSERVGEGVGHPRLDSAAGEELIHVEPSVAVALGRRPPESPGTLYVSTKRVIWLSDTDTSRGYAVDFLSVALHAVSRDLEAYPSPCIYTQIDIEDNEDSDSEVSDSDGTEDGDLSKISEMRLMPSDPSQLDTLFDVFCRCAELNPEPTDDVEEDSVFVYGNDVDMADDGSDDDSEGQFSETLANPIGYANGNHDLTHTLLELQINDDRFEDAEEWEQEPRDDQH